MATGHHRRTPALDTMHPDTLAALQRLAAALIAHPEDATTLHCYGHLPAHLADAIEDHEPEAV